MATRSVQRALDILEALRQSSQPLSLRELADAVELDKATTMRIARDLIERQYVEQSAESKRYALGGAVLELAERVWGRDSLAQATLHHLEDLRDRTLQTVSLCSAAGQQYIVSLELPSLEPIKYALGVGTVRPLADDAPGHAILAFGRAGAEGRTGFARVREDGYAFTESTTLPRVASVAAPVFGESQLADAAVCLSWVAEGAAAEPATRRRFSTQVMACAARISRLRQTRSGWL